MSYPKHLFLVNDHFYFKVRVPVDLQSLFPTPLIKKSLKTTDLAVAKAHLVAMEYQTMRIRKRMVLDDDKEFVMHALRHTTATRLLDRGIDLYTVKEWLGHSTIQVTERYAHLRPDKLVHAANMLEI